MSKFLPKDEILSIKSVDLFTYLKTCFPSELQLFCNGTYTTKTHSSLKISNGLWHYFKEGIGGKNAVDYLVKVENYDFLSACNKVKNDMNLKNNISLEEIEEQRLKNDFEQNELFEKYRRIEALTPEILNEFVEKIYLGKYNEASNSREIKIIWNIDKKEEIV